MLPAAGAALLAREHGTQSVYPGLERLMSHLAMMKYQGQGLAPLLADEEFLTRCSPLSEVHEAPPAGKVEAYLGVDVGNSVCQQLRIHWANGAEVSRLAGSRERS